MSHPDEDLQYQQETDPNLPYYYPYQFFHHQETFTCPSVPYPYIDTSLPVYNAAMYNHQTTVHPETAGSSSQGTPEIQYTQTPPLTETFISSSQGTPEVLYTQTLPLTEHAAETFIPPNPLQELPVEVLWAPHTECRETYVPTSSPSNSQESPEDLTSPYNSDETLPISELGPSTSSHAPTAHTHITHHDVRLRSNIDGALLEKNLMLLSSRPKIFRCMVPGCIGPDLKGAQAAKAHVYRHVFGPDKPYVCRTCKVEFASERAAERHRRYQEKRFSCGICGRPFARKDARQAHEKKAKCGGALVGFSEVG